MGDVSAGPVHSEGGPSGEDSVLFGSGSERPAVWQRDLDYFSTHSLSFVVVPRFGGKEDFGIDDSQGGGDGYLDQTQLSGGAGSGSDGGYCFVFGT